MPQASEAFAALLDRARAGDRAAAAELAQQYERAVRLVARKSLGPALRPYLDSMDLVQSVHKSLLIGLRQNRYAFNSPDDLLALALTMVHRKVARHWRHLRRQKRFDGDATASGNLPQVLTSLCSSEADPAQAAQVNDAVQQFCRYLNEMEQQILGLSLDGYNSGDIARELSMDPDVVRVYRSRLRHRLRASGLLGDWL